MSNKLQISGDFENDFIWQLQPYFGDVIYAGEDFIQFEVDYCENDINEINNIINNLKVNRGQIALRLTWD